MPAPPRAACPSAARRGARFGRRGGGAVPVDNRPWAVFGAAAVESFLAEHATASDWPGERGAHTLTVLSGTPVVESSGFGAQNRPRVVLSADYYGATSGTLATFMAGATPKAFSIVWVWQPDSITASRALGGWGSSAGGVNGSYCDVWTRATGYSHRWHRDDNTNVDIEPITGCDLDTVEKALIISYAGSTGALRIDEWSELSGWATAISSTPTNNAAMTTIDRFIIGGRLAGSGTPTVPINPVNIAECHVANAAITDAQFTSIRAWVTSRYGALSEPPL